MFVQLEKPHNRPGRPRRIDVASGMDACDHRSLSRRRIQSAARSAGLAGTGGVVNLAIGFNSLLLQGKWQDLVSLAANHQDSAWKRELRGRPYCSGNDSKRSQNFAALRPQQIT